MTYPFTYKGNEYHTSIDDTLLVAFTSFGINSKDRVKPACYLRIARNPVFFADLSENPLCEKYWFVDNLPNFPTNTFTEAELHFFENAYETMSYSEIYDDLIFRNLIVKNTSYYVKSTSNPLSKPFYKEISREEWESIAVLVRKP